MSTQNVEQAPAATAKPVDAERPLIVQAADARGFVAVRRHPAQNGGPAQETAAPIEGNNICTRLNLRRNQLLENQLKELETSANQATLQADALNDAADSLVQWKGIGDQMLKTAQDQQRAAAALNDALTTQLSQHREQIDTLKASNAAFIQAVNTAIGAQNDLIQAHTNAVSGQSDILGRMNTSLEKLASRPLAEPLARISVDADDFDAIAQIGAVLAHFIDQKEADAESTMQKLRKAASNAIKQARAVLENQGKGPALEKFNAADDSLHKIMKGDDFWRNHLYAAVGLLLESMLLAAQDASHEAPEPPKTDRG